MVTEQQLDEWARTRTESQAIVVELVWRLVAAAVPSPRDRRFPLSINQPGPDGFLYSEIAAEPFVPEGRSFWEIGTGITPGKKATDDYRDLTRSVPRTEREDSTFVFVTPLSGRRDSWISAPAGKGMARWLKSRQNKKQWKNVRVLDGTKLIDWMSHFPSVAAWFAGTVLGAAAGELEPPTSHWETIRRIGDPPPLIPEIFLAGRDQATQRMGDLFSGSVRQVALETHYPDQVIDFVAAHVASLAPEAQVDVAGRCLIVHGEAGWKSAVALTRRHTLVASSSLDLSDPGRTKLIQMARNSGHDVVFGVSRGGLPDPSRCPLPSPSVDQIKASLEKATYPRERARMLAQRSAGNLPALLRCIQNVSLLPAWAEGTTAAELSVCALIGQWDDSNTDDQTAIERISGKGYGEWIAAIREVAARPGTPLHHREGVWRFASRFEGWHALGSRLFDEHIERFCAVAVEVLGEDHPGLALPVGERYLAPIRGLEHQHSVRLRQGLAEGLALLGSYPEALIRCPTGSAAARAAIAVRRVLEPMTWERWATLDRLLPLLAEAAPAEFLDGLDRAIAVESQVFESLFGQEGDPITGGNYVSGVLWALETLAWNPELLGRVTLCLGDLAARDPGGRWSNRPANTLRSIYLPWFPQTMATLEQQRAALVALKREQPEVGWKLALALLPDHHSTAMSTARPSWRNFIAENWSEGATREVRRSQEEFAAGLALQLAGADPLKLAEIVEHSAMLHEPSLDTLVERLSSPEVLGLNEESRTPLWQTVEAEVLKHRKFTDATWAMPASRIERLAVVSRALAPKAPALRHRRLFSDRSVELYEGRGNYEEESAKLERRRLTAVSEVASDGGPSAVLAFAETVDSPWIVGIAFASAGSQEADRGFLPLLLGSEVGPKYSFLAGYVAHRRRLAGWDWVDSLPISTWTPADRGRFLSLLPFDQSTWDRVADLLGADATEYWTRTNAQPYHTDGDLAVGADGLLEYGRPRAALHCLHWLSRFKKQTDSPRILRALESAMQSDEKWQLDGHEIAELFDALQQDPAVDQDALLLAEWRYLRALRDLHGPVRPRTLEARLARDPGFFSEVVRIAFRSTKPAEGSDTPKETEASLALNAYSLLNQWNRVPGLSADGSLDPKALAEWLRAVKEECAESGHLEIAMETVGRALTHAPPDPTGLWIHRGVAELLDGRDADDLRSGFRVQAYNSRGIHWVDPTGDQERALAADFRAKAAAVEGEGFHRFGATLRMIADGYDSEAESMASRHSRED